MIVLANIFEWWRSLHYPVKALLDLLRDNFPAPVAYIVSGLIGASVIGAYLGVAMLLLIWVERRVIARIQIRQGPNRAGPWGLLQPVADAIKLMQKEALTPRHGDKWVFWLAPLLLFIPTVLTMGVIPFGEKMAVADLNVGLLFIIAVGSGAPLIVFMAAWSSNNKYGLLGGMRTIAMVLSYELPAVIALLSVVALTGTMQLGGIVEFQQDNFLWNVLILPLPFVIYLIASIAEIGRSPYDIAEAESEIVAGYHVEYSGMKFGLFYAVELANALILGGIFATLFFGGWFTFFLDKIIPNWLIFQVKMILGYWLFVWARGTVPRLRIDQSLKFSWQFLIPLGLLNVVLVAFETALIAQLGASEFVYWLFAPVNWALAAVLVVGYVRTFRRTDDQTPRTLELREDVGIVTTVPAAAGTLYSGIGTR